MQKYKRYGLNVDGLGSQNHRLSLFLFHNTDYDLLISIKVRLKSNTAAWPYNQYLNENMEVHICFLTKIRYLTYCGWVMPYGNIELGQHWLK